MDFLGLPNLLAIASQIWQARAIHATAPTDMNQQSLTYLIVETGLRFNHDFKQPLPSSSQAFFPQGRRSRALPLAIFSANAPPLVH
jgi:hypothetical protein